MCGTDERKRWSWPLKNVYELPERVLSRERDVMTRETIKQLESEVAGQNLLEKIL
jgi:hypothetical protein